MENRIILHIDVNNAFLSWTAVEMLKQGSSIDIRNIPSIIGGDEDRRAGIVLAKSMKAKQCGIRTAETIYMAKRKCRDLQIYRGLPYKKYREYSDRLYNLLLKYSNIIERFSIDECFVDITNFLMGRAPINIAYEIKDRVKKEFGFTVNVGVSENKLLAKMASDFEKPDKVHTLFRTEIKEKMWGLPVSELFMLGKKTVPKLYNMGIKTIGELAKTDKQILVKKFGKFGNTLWEYANGIDNSPVKYQKDDPKSIGNSVTLPTDVHNIESVNEILLTLSEQVAYRLRKYNLYAHTVNVQLRTKDFHDFSHQKSFNTATASTKEIYNKATEILKDMYKEGMYIRLIGIRVDNLSKKEDEQISLFDEKTDEKQEKLDKVLDNIKQKYGYGSIKRAGTLKTEDIIKFKEE